MTAATLKEEFVKDSLKIPITVAEFYGFNIFKPNYKLNFRAYFVISMLIGWWVFSFYTIILEFSTDWTIIVRVSLYVGIAIQLGVKITCIVGFSDTFYNLFQSILDIYEEYEKKGFKYTLVLKKTSKYTAIASKMLIALYIVGVSIILTSPLAIAFLTGEKTFFILFYIPGIPPYATNTTYGLTYAIHIIYGVLGSAGLAASDLLFVVYVLAIYLLVQIFQLKFDELRCLLDDENSSVDEKEITRCVKDICKWHQKYCNYLDDVNRAFFFFIFVVIMTNSLTLVLGFYSVLAVNFYGGYFVILIQYVSMQAYCALGVYSAIMTEKITEIICECDWYKLSQSDKKSLMFMMMQSQRTRPLSCGGFAPLNFSLGVQITKILYSYAMMLMESLTDA